MAKPTLITPINTKKQQINIRRFSNFGATNWSIRDEFSFQKFHFKSLHSKLHPFGHYSLFMIIDED